MMLRQFRRDTPRTSIPSLGRYSETYKARESARRWRNAFLILLGTVCIIGFGASLPAIERWERDNGYPFGIRCQINNSCPPGALERLEALRSALK